MKSQKIIVAIDTSDISEADFILRSLDPQLCMIKVGSIAFSSLGKDFLNLVSKKGFKIFLDLKFHDIPNTVFESILSFSDCSIDMLTVHLSGGKSMLEKALEAAKKINSKVIGVSMLTSLNDNDSIQLFDATILSQITRLFALANQINLDGVVCSPQELKIANTILKTNIIKITPGIRETKSNDDQARTMTAKKAISLGATFIVVGRPITKSEDIAASLQNFNILINE